MTQVSDKSLDPALEEACRKRSFLKLPVSVDLTRLREEYERIPSDVWGASYWDVHCSIDSALLRGGTKGNADDYVTTEVSNTPLLDESPYLTSLLAPDGPFGGAVYAFIFRMEPDGTTQVHVDDNDAWLQPVRVHIPIETNDGALLMSEARACHFSAGGCWTFDNQLHHAVVNGPTTRVHLIFDVYPNPKLAELMATADYRPGEFDLASWTRAGGRKCGGLVPPLPVAIGQALDSSEKERLGLAPESFATKLTRLSRRGKLARTGLRVGDIITAIDGVETGVAWHNALDHLRTKHAPGDTVSIRVLRVGTERSLNVRLRSPDFLSPRATVSALTSRLGIT